MKKAVKLLSVLLLGMLVSMPVYAEAEADVWHETNVEGNSLSVSIETNGKATDGVVTIGYEPSLIDCTEDDVKIGESVAMHSVNVEIDKSGKKCVRISFLAEDAIEAGTVAEIGFNVVDENADEETLKSAVTSVYGSAYNENGEPVIVATPSPEPTGTPEPTEEPTGTPEPTEEPTGTPEPTEEPTESPEPTAEPTESPEPTVEPTEAPKNPDDGGTDADSGDGNGSKTPGAVTTGDDTDLSAYLILSLVTGGLLVALAVRRVLAVTGRKSNH